MIPVSLLSEPTLAGMVPNRRYHARRWYLAQVSRASLLSIPYQELERPFPSFKPLVHFVVLCGLKPPLSFNLFTELQFLGFNQFYHLCVRMSF